jgi:Flp pilus assembly protein TadG
MTDLLANFRLRFRNRLHRFANCDRGISAVEFALLMPLMLVLLTGIIFAGEALTASRKVDQIGATIVDLIAQRSTISSTQVTTLLNGAATIISPYSDDSLSIIVSVLNVSGTTATVSWSGAYNATAQSSGASPLTTLDSDILESGVQLVLVQVKYTYDSEVLSSLTRANFGSSSIAFERYYVARPRLSDTISET